MVAAPAAWPPSRESASSGPAQVASVRRDDDDDEVVSTRAAVVEAPHARRPIGLAGSVAVGAESPLFRRRSPHAPRAGAPAPRVEEDEDAIAMPPWWRRMLFGGLAAVTFLPRVAFHMAATAFFAVLHAIHMVAIFLLTGWRSRHLAASLPALLVLGLVAGLATARALTSDADLLHRYLQAAATAVRAKDYAAARTYYQKAMQLGERRPEVRYALALCQEHLGRAAEAQALLAPLKEEGPGSYPPALCTAASSYCPKKNLPPKR